MKPCQPGHQWTWTGPRIGDRVLDGDPCDCGKTVARWGDCPLCGAERLEAVPVGPAERAAIEHERIIEEVGSPVLPPYQMDSCVPVCADTRCLPGETIEWDDPNSGRVVRR